MVDFWARHTEVPKYVTKLTQWLSERDLILKNARTVKRLGLHELDRMRDGQEDRSRVDRVTDDDINEYTCYKRY